MPDTPIYDAMVREQNMSELIDSLYAYLFTMNPSETVDGRLFALGMVEDALSQGGVEAVESLPIRLPGEYGAFADGYANTIRYVQYGAWSDGV